MKLHAGQRDEMRAPITEKTIFIRTILCAYQQQKHWGFLHCVFTFVRKVRVMILGPVREMTIDF